jgi:hypothetical protein
MVDISELAFIILFTLFGMVFLIGGSVFAYDSYNAHVETQNEIDNSIKTTGKVISNNIDQTTSRDPETNTYETYYHFTAKYEYQVEGVSYVSESIQPAQDTLISSSRSEAEDFREKYGVGDEVTVYYQSDNPDESYLQGGGGGLLFPAIVSPLFIIAGLIIVRAGLLALIELIREDIFGHSDDQ